MYSFIIFYQTGYINVKGVSDYIGKFWSKQTFPNGSDPQLFASSNAANRCVHLRHYILWFVPQYFLHMSVHTYTPYTIRSLKKLLKTADSHTPFSFQNIITMK